ncbi:MAG: hypothetical protein CVT93_02820 [Bacteroidetes bacterium HGW-Bacteroidetes-10]|nr:MAG: hypothetical protein CVT93_02820 [Bacteroidetes bacterium HGW-Bacteroidetes-10]
MFRRDNNAGLYLTIAVHLVVLIVLLSTRIGFEIREENAFVLDFTREEELEKQEKEEQFKEEISKELDDIIAGRTPVRNVVVDAGSRNRALRDDRFKNPNQVYDEAKALQAKLDAAKRDAEREQGSDDVSAKQNEVKKEAQPYRGPSVISYTLEGRKAVSLPIPVYKCVAGGDVSVAISVNRKGYVVAATVIDNASASDNCLRDYAIKAAKSSRFTASSSASEKQTGEIVYRFVAQ